MRKLPLPCFADPRGKPTHEEYVCLPCPDPPRRQGRSPRGVPFPAMGKEPKDRPGHLPKGSPGPLLPAKGKTARRFPPLDPPSGDERQKPRSSRQSGGFDGKRMSNRTHASIRGHYGNRGCAAREFRDDEGPLWRFFFSGFFLAGKKKSGRRRLTCETSAETIYDSTPGRGRARRCGSSLAPASQTQGKADRAAGRRDNT